MNALHKYMETVTAILPSASGMELGLRCRLCYHRDNASASLRRCDEVVIPILEELVRLSSLWIYSPQVDKLEAMDAYITQLYQSARELNKAFTTTSGRKGE